MAIPSSSRTALKEFISLLTEVDERWSSEEWNLGSAEDIAAYFERHDLPRHPLIERGFPSIGCSPCTRQVGEGEDARAGRWSGWDKVECCIHKPGEEPFL